jgi:hypothetical protein
MLADYSNKRHSVEQRNTENTLKPCKRRWQKGVQKCVKETKSFGVLSIVNRLK